MNTYEKRALEALINKKAVDEDIGVILKSFSGELMEELRKEAFRVCESVYGDEVYLRGLIEISSYCSRNCIYCGLRTGIEKAERYRLSEEDIMSSVHYGNSLGLKTFVLQGGEDPMLTDIILENIIGKIKEEYPDSRITLSLGVRSYSSLKRLKEAGADRYLLRHETADEELFSRLHRDGQSLSSRKECLYNLKDLGYTVGTGFLVGAPWSSVDSYLKDIGFMRELKPHMAGIGPFLPHRDTPVGDFSPGSLELTLKLISILRILFPEILLPSTTALNTLDPRGRVLGILHGANVVMPNISPKDARVKYSLYNNKMKDSGEASQYIEKLKKDLEHYGRIPVTDRGDPKNMAVNYGGI